jgi:membrane protein
MSISSLYNSSKNFYFKIQDFILLILKHNIFFHASAISYYAALAIAPFLLILLQVGALLGNRLQSELISQTYFVLGPEVGKITEMIFSNANEGINFASMSGIIGGGTLLFTAVLFFLSLFVSNIVKYLAGTDMEEGIWGLIVSNFLSFLINMMMFSAVYYFAPTRTPKLKAAVKMAIFTSVAFIFGKILMGLYFKNVAMSSVYGAAGTLLVFLVWAYYSSFTMFLSVEGFLFLHQEKSINDNHVVKA